MNVSDEVVKNLGDFVRTFVSMECLTLKKLLFLYSHNLVPSFNDPSPALNQFCNSLHHIHMILRVCDLMEESSVKISAHPDAFLDLVHQRVIESTPEAISSLLSRRMVLTTDQGTIFRTGTVRNLVLFFYMPSVLFHKTLMYTHLKLNDPSMEKGNVFSFLGQGVYSNDLEDLNDLPDLYCHDNNKPGYLKIIG